MRIVNKKKFIRSTSITMGILIFTILTLSNISLSHVETKYKEIAVSSGDTLWSLAQYEKNTNLYFENRDIRDVINEIKKLNNLSSSNLKVGDKLNIPII